MLRQPPTSPDGNQIPTGSTTQLPTLVCLPFCYLTAAKLGLTFREQVESPHRSLRGGFFWARDRAAATTAGL